LSSIHLRTLRTVLSSHNTRAEFLREATFETVEATILKFSRWKHFGKEKICYVFGMGKQPKSTYVALQQEDGLEVLFYRSILPWFAKPLRYVMASYEGLIRIDDPSRLSLVFHTLLDQSMVGVYFIHESMQSELLRAASEALPTQDLGVKVDPTYVMYIVDADNEESSTGIVEIISYGIGTPTDQIPA